MQPIRSSPGFKALLERRRAKREGLIEEARAYAARARAGLGEARVFLYGPVARGDFNLASDLDLLVVSPQLPADPLSALSCFNPSLWAARNPRACFPTSTLA